MDPTALTRYRRLGDQGCSNGDQVIAAETIAVFACDLKARVPCKTFYNRYVIASMYWAIRHGQFEIEILRHYSGEGFTIRQNQKEAIREIIEENPRRGFK